MKVQSISPDSVRSYCGFGSGSALTERLKVVVEMVDWLQNEQLLEEVFFSIGLSGFLVSDRREFTWQENMLKIDATRSPDFVVFEYFRIYGSTDVDRKHCRRSEAIETLREFLAYKFGIYRPKRPNQSPEPTAMSVTPPAAQEPRQP